MTPSETAIAAIRFGYGFHPDQNPPRGADDLVRQLRAPDLASSYGPSMRERRALYNAYITARRANSGEEAARHVIRDLMNEDLVRRVRLPIASRTGFFERLATFWSDHFTVALRSQASRVAVGLHEADAIRPHITGNFRDMLRAAVLHPAMLLFLNQPQSIGPNSKVGKRTGRGVNENLAREIIELHTLGVKADYSQKDIRQFAYLLSGLRIDKDTGEAAFVARAAEPGTKTILGRTYGRSKHDLSDIEAALDDFARHPATAQHIARKIAVHFVSDEPPQSLVDDMARTFTANDGQLFPVYEALLAHPESWSRFGEKVKQPFDYVVSSIRAAGGERARIWRQRNGMLTIYTLRRLNQPLMTAPGPDGWPEDARAWINAQGLTVRLSWASRVARFMGPNATPRDFLATALSDVAREETLFAVTNAAEKWEGVALTLACPEFNRR